MTYTKFKKGNGLFFLFCSDICEWHVSWLEKNSLKYSSMQSHMQPENKGTQKLICGDSKWVYMYHVHCILNKCHIHYV